MSLYFGSSILELMVFEGQLSVISLARQRFLQTTLRKRRDVWT